MQGKLSYQIPCSCKPGTLCQTSTRTVHKPKYVQFYLDLEQLAGPTAPWATGHGARHPDLVCAGRDWRMEAAQAARSVCAALHAEREQHCTWEQATPPLHLQKGELQLRTLKSTEAILQFLRSNTSISPLQWLALLFHNTVASWNMHVYKLKS